MDTCTRETSHKINFNVIYDRNEAATQARPQFKPGRTPECVFGDHILNHDVDWLKIIQQIVVAKKCTLSVLSQDIEVDQTVLEDILNKDFTLLSFKAGAKLLRVHSILGL